MITDLSDEFETSYTIIHYVGQTPTDEEIRDYIFGRDFERIDGLPPNNPETEDNPNDLGFVTILYK